MKNMVVLAIDFGTVRIGLAISRYTLAEPLMIIANNQETFKQLKQVCQKEKVNQIVVGISENEMARKTLQFVANLKEEMASNWDMSIPIELTDETLSSNTVHQKLKTAKKSKRSSDIDHYAATVFLQEWLDEQ